MTWDSFERFRFILIQEHFKIEALFAWFMLGQRKVNISFRFDLLIDTDFSV